MSLHFIASFNGIIPLAPIQELHNILPSAEMEWYVELIVKFHSYYSAATSLNPHNQVCNNHTGVSNTNKYAATRTCLSNCLKSLFLCLHYLNPSPGLD